MIVDSFTKSIVTVWELYALSLYVTNLVGDPTKSVKCHINSLSVTESFLYRVMLSLFYFLYFFIYFY